MKSNTISCFRNSEIRRRYKIITKEGEILTDYVIYTTGSSPKSLKMIENLGHKIVSPVPSLFTFNIKNDVLNDLMGTSFPHAEVSIPKLKMEEFRTSHYTLGTFLTCNS
ncbi:MAG: NAD(P)/FAD-dependent oxidoreductase [Cloacibacterium normanense]